MAKGTIRGIYAILSGAFEAAMRWDWADRNPAAHPAPPDHPGYLAGRCGQGDRRGPCAQRRPGAVPVAGGSHRRRRGELCGLQIRDIDLDRALVHIAFNYVVRGGQRVRKDTKTHQRAAAYDRSRTHWLSLEPAVLSEATDWIERKRACGVACSASSRST
jgi:integrase